MQQLTSAEAALVASVDAAPMLDQVLAWSAINTGTGNLAGTVNPDNHRRLEPNIRK